MRKLFRFIFLFCVPIGLAIILLYNDFEIVNVDCTIGIEVIPKNTVAVLFIADVPGQAVALDYGYLSWVVSIIHGQNNFVVSIVGVCGNVNVLDIVNIAVAVIEQIVVAGVIWVNSPEFEAEVAVSFRG